MSLFSLFFSSSHAVGLSYLCFTAVATTNVMCQTHDLSMAVKTLEESLVLLQRSWSTFRLRSELSSGKVVNHCPLTLSCELLKIFYRLGNVQLIDSSKFRLFNHTTSAQQIIIVKKRSNPHRPRLYNKYARIESS